MAWGARNAEKTTRHTCGGPAFGKKTPGCPRCDELIGGAEPVVWANTGKRDEEIRRAEMDVHFAPGGKHATGGCGPVCTAFDW